MPWRLWFWVNVNCQGLDNLVRGFIVWCLIVYSLSLFQLVLLLQDLSNTFFPLQFHVSVNGLCVLSSCRAAVRAIPSLPSPASPTRPPSSPLPPLNPWRPCQKPTFPSGSTGWIDFARACRCPALPARISYDLQVKIWSTCGLSVTICWLDSRQFPNCLFIEAVWISQVYWI